MQLSWIDPEALRELASKLDHPAPVKEEPVVHQLAVERAVEANLLGAAPDHPGKPSPEPESHAPAPGPADLQVARIREQLKMIRNKALQAGLLPAEPPPPPPEAPPSPPVSAPAAPVFSPAPAAVMAPNPPPVNPFRGNTLGERLDEFARWASGRLAAEDLLLVDDHGDVLWGTKGRADLALTALLSLNTALRSTAGGGIRPPGLIRNQLSPGRELTVLPCSTRHGTVTLALLNAKDIPQDAVDSLREHLVHAVEG